MGISAKSDLRSDLGVCHADHRTGDAPRVTNFWFRCMAHSGVLHRTVSPGLVRSLANGALLASKRDTLPGVVEIPIYFLSSSPGIILNILVFVC